MLDSDSESKHKKHKREHRNGSRRKGDEELEDGELGKYTMAMLIFAQTHYVTRFNNVYWLVKLCT